MRKARFYTTIAAVLWGMIFAYALVQIQRDPTFLLGDILRLTLPDNFVGVHYTLKNDVLFVSAVGLPEESQLDIVVSYNPDRVILDMDALSISHTLVRTVSNVGELLLTVVLNGPENIFSIPFVSDPEYHILVSDVSLSGESVAIQRIGFVENL
jgi:hypothetical protein